MEPLGIEVEPRRRVLLDRVGVATIGGVSLAIAAITPSLIAIFATVGSWFAILGLVVVATLYWSPTTDAAVFASLTVGFVLPVSFIVLTGKVEAAMAVGFLSALITLVVVSLLSRAG